MKVMKQYFYGNEEVSLTKWKDLKSKSGVGSTIHTDYIILEAEDLCLEQNILTIIPKAIKTHKNNLLLHRPHRPKTYPKLEYVTSDLSQKIMLRELPTLFTTREIEDIGLGVLLQ